MIKTKWVEFSVRKNQGQIISAFSERQFSKTTPVGFDLLEIFPNRIYGKFIQEIIDTDEFVDPFGNEVKNVSRRYITIDFNIFSIAENKFLLRVDDPPRSLKTLISLMSETLGQEFSIKIISVDILKFLLFLSKNLNRPKISIKKVYLNDVKIKDLSLAKISVTSEFDAYQDICETIDLYGSSFERALLKIDVPGEQVYDIEVSSGGVIIGHDMFFSIYNNLVCDFLISDKK